MNINSNFNQEARPNAEEAMSQAMSFLYENFILPKTADLNKDDLDTLTIIGAIFKDMASKAEAYYQLQENSYEENDFSRN
jgi:hypothetical protein